MVGCLSHNDDFGLPQLTYHDSCEKVNNRVSPGPYKSLKVLKFHTFKYKALKSP